jgi:pimeloyl-ACP methyl ester carboxylesterase
MLRLQHPTSMRRRLAPVLALCAAAASGALAAGCLTPAARLERAPALVPHETRGDDGLRFVDVGDAFLRVRVKGPTTPGSATKTPLVLVHGFGARLENWRAVQDAFSADRVVVAFDMKGFGQSERSDGEYGPDKHGADVLRVMDALGIDRAVVAGHSYGGGVVMRALLQDPSRVVGVGLVDALILEAQVPTSFRWAKAPVLGEAIFSVFFTELPGEKYVMAFHDGQRFASAKVLDEVHTMQHRPGSTFAQLRTVRAMGYADVEARYLQALGDKPRVVVWGEADRVTPLRHGKLVAAAVDAPLVVIPASGHVPIIERPAPVIAALRELLLAADAAPTTTPTTTTTTPTTTTPAKPTPTPTPTEATAAEPTTAATTETP